MNTVSVQGMSPRTAIAVALTAAGALSTLSAAPAVAAGPSFESGHGITVRGVDTIDARTVRVRISSPAITAPDQLVVRDKQLSVIVRLPAGYDTSTRRYPSLYMLHGRGGNPIDFSKAVFGVPALANQDVIIVVPEGGRGSWYTNWVNQPRGQAQWETFHVNQLIPWIDANLRTVADGKKRAIGGFSMGGYGAMHYAFKHPGTFAHASSYSGGVDLESQLVRVAVTGTPAAEGFQLSPVDGTGPFGSPIYPFDTRWKKENPVRHADQLRGTGVSLYSGNGRTSNPVSGAIEAGAQQATKALDNRLDGLGIAHHTDLYGNNASAGGFSCDGGHTLPCFQMALTKDTPNILRALN